MNCNEAGEFLVSARDEQSASKSRDFANHVQSCPSCARMASVSDVRREMVEATMDRIVPVPPFFSARVMAAIAERRQEAERRAFDPWAWIWQMARRTVPVMVGLVVLVGILTFGYSPAEPDQLPTTNSYISQIDNALIPSDAPQSIIFTSSGDLTPDRVLSTVIDGQANND